MLSLCPYFFHQNCPFNFVTCETAALQQSLGSVVQENFLVGLIGTTLELQSGELDFSFSTHELTMQISPLFCRLSTVSTRISYMLHLDCQLLPCLLLVQHHSGTLMRSNHLCVKKQYADGLLTSVLQAAVEQSPLATDAQCVMFYRNTAWGNFSFCCWKAFLCKEAWAGQYSSLQGQAHLEAAGMVVAMGEALCYNASADPRSCWRVLLWHTVFLRNVSITCGLPLADTVEPITRPPPLDFKHPVVRLQYSLLVKGSSARKWRAQKCECKMLYLGCTGDQAVTGTRGCLCR